MAAVIVILIAVELIQFSGTIISCRLLSKRLVCFIVIFLNLNKNPAFAGFGNGLLVCTGQK